MAKDFFVHWAEATAADVGNFLVVVAAVEAAVALVRNVFTKVVFGGVLEAFQ